MSQHTGTIRDMGLLDLSSAQSAEDLSGITSIHDVGAIIIPEDLMSALIRIDIHDVGSVVPIPRGANVSLHMGQTRLTGEALAAGPEDTVLVLVGQTLITSPVQTVGYQALHVIGQLLAPRGSEGVLTAKIAKLTGQAVYLTGMEHARFIMGKERIGRAFLELLTHPTPLVVVGKLTIEEGTPADLLREKVPEIALLGKIQAPEELVPLLQVLTVEKQGVIEAL
ncbi:MAG: hypothetical protein GXX93_05730 [Anaerolineae bacterium]|nr:hypothetical protein [Anaerolineae bacterium]